MADTDPPYKVNDRESPSDRDIDAPDPGAASEQVRDRRIEDAHDGHRNCDYRKPEDGRVLGQHDAADAISNRGQRLTRPNHWRPYAFWRQYIDFVVNPRGHSLCLL